MRPLPSSTPALSRFTVTPQRMRMIVEAFKESLELGLAKHNQIVVSVVSALQGQLVTHIPSYGLAHDSHLCLRMAHRRGEGELSRSRSW